LAAKKQEKQPEQTSDWVGLGKALLDNISELAQIIIHLSTIADILVLPLWGVPRNGTLVPSTELELPATDELVFSGNCAFS
jgi:hypothetical protein